jgi:hypothetical protein
MKYSRSLAFLVASCLVGAWLFLAAVLIDAALVRLGIYDLEDALWELLDAFVVLGALAGAGSLIVRVRGSDRLRFPLLLGWERGRPGRSRALITEMARALLFR